MFQKTKGIYISKTRYPIFLSNFFVDNLTMSEPNLPFSQRSQTLSPVLSEKSDKEQHSDLYHSLEQSMLHPNCVSPAWIDTIGDFKYNPRLLTTAPYNDTSLHWVDKDQKLLCMAFPAMLDIEGKFSPISISQETKEPKYVFHLFMMITSI